MSAAIRRIIICQFLHSVNYSLKHFSSRWVKLFVWFSIPFHIEQVGIEVMGSGGK